MKVRLGHLVARLLLASVMLLLAVLVSGAAAEVVETPQAPASVETAQGHADEDDVELSPTAQKKMSRAMVQKTAGHAARALAVTAGADPGEVGQWGPIVEWPVVAVHATVLPNGKVLAYASVGTKATEAYSEQTHTEATVWDPTSGSQTNVTLEDGFNIFCSGLAQMTNGNLFIAGGNKDQQLNGIVQTHLFDWENDSWSQGPNMAAQRWYPSVTPMGNGEMLITSGGAPIPEIRQNDGTLRRLSDASLELPLYPWFDVAPDGRAFYSGPDQTMRSLNPSGTGSWQTFSQRDSINRSYGSHAMYEPGKILVAGGGPSTNTADVINLNGATPTVTATGTMKYGRRQNNLTILADGSVLGTGGNSSGAELVDLNAGVYPAEVWNPTTGVWKELASMQVTRQYHSTALLLPDGRVLSAGGGICGICDTVGYLGKNAEIFSPPYLFKKDGSGALAERPTISASPGTVTEGTQYTVTTPNAASIAKVALVRLGAVTHSNNMEQRYVPASFTVSGNNLTVTAPASTSMAPPGYYMLFVVNSSGVPSVAPILHVSPPETAPPPTASLKITSVISAPSGSSQASTKVAFSGTCPSSFTTAALGTGESVTPTLTGAVEGASCSVSEVPPSGTGWKTTATVNGKEVALAFAEGKTSIASVPLVGGVNTVQFTNSYSPLVSVSDPTAGGWTLNGSAKLTATELQLTEAASGQAGTGFWPTAVNPQNLTIEFDATIGGGSGADGLALVLGDTSKGAVPTSVGVGGGGLGFSGIPGLAIALDTYQNSVNPSSNFVGVSDGPTTTAKDLLHWLATANLSSSLRTATNHVKVVTTSTTVTVFVNGTQVLSTSATLPASAYLGFSGGTGGNFDRHAIAHLVVSGGETTPPPPPSATLKVASVVSAPLGSPQASTKIAFTGSCPSSFTTAALGNGESATPALTEATEGQSCVVSETPPTEAGWKTTATVNGKEVTLVSNGDKLSLPSFALAAGLNTVQFTNTYTPAAEPASLNLGVAVSAPAGSEQLAQTFVLSGTCPSSFTSAALGNAGTASPALTGAVTGAGCNVSEAAPSAAGWTATASVNGAAPVVLTAAEGKYKVPAFALAGGVNSVQFTNTYTAPTPASLKVGVTVSAPAGSEQLAQTFAVSGTCPSSFTTSPLGNAGSATPALTGAVQGSACNVSEAAPTGTGWTASASVNGAAAVALSLSGEKWVVPAFALAGGVNTIQLTDTYTPVAPVTVPDPTAGGWTFNGSAALSGTELVLTSATKFQRGDGIYPKAIDPRNMTLEFDASITGGTGADGMALFFADVSKGAKTTQVGVEGGGLGFSGIPGIAVALDEYKGTGAPSANFIGISDGPTSAAAPDVLHWLATSNLAVPIQNASTHVKVVDANGTTTVFVNGTQVISQAVALPASAYIGFSAGTGGLTNRHAVSKLIVNGEPPAPASLNVGVALSAPLGSEQAATKLAVSGTCPSSFTTAALGSKESATPALTGAVAGAACNVAEAAPTGGGWTATASVNGGAPVALTAAEGKYKVPAFALAGGVNSVQFTNTYTAPTPASLNVGVAVKAPAGSEQLAQTFLASGSCPSSFTTVALASGASATPALTGAVAGASCSVSEAAPSASGWTATASVNGGTPVSLTASAGKFTVSTFALLGGTNTVQFTNTYTPAAPVTVPDPSAGGWTFNGSAALSGTELVLTGATKFQRGDGMYPTAIDPRSLTVEFDASITGGTGADGMALFFADVSKGAKTTQVGVEGGGLGFSGIPGIAIALDEYKGTGAPSANFIGISDGPTSTATPDVLHWLATANLSAAIQGATTHVKVVNAGGTTTVFVNGTQVLSQAVALPTSAYLGFSAGTGGLTNRHAVSKVIVTSP